jgi:DNA polymerase-3 subunit beta
MNAITVTVPAAHVNAALQAVSDEKARYYLCGLFFDARGYIVATNGHILFAARCSDAGKLTDCRPSYAPDSAMAGVIVPTDALAQAIKAAGRSKGPDMTINRDAQGQWWILHGNARVAFTPVDGTFPDWQRVIPSAPETLTPAHFDPRYIAAIGNMSKALRDGKKDGASCFTLHQDGDNPALVTFNRAVTYNADTLSPVGPRDDCLAVIMPMRTHFDIYADAAFRDAFLTA